MEPQNTDGNQVERNKNRGKKEFTSKLELGTEQEVKTQDLVMYQRSHKVTATISKAISKPLVLLSTREAPKNTNNLQIKGLKSPP